MSMFSQVFKAITLFKGASVAQLSEFAHIKGQGFSVSAFSTMKTGARRTVNTDVLLGIGLFFNVSPSFLLEGKPHNSDVYGFAEEGRGVTAFLITPVLFSMVDYLAKYEPQINGEKSSWDDTKERGYTALPVSLEDSLRGERHDYPIFPITFNGVIVGMAMTEDKASWVEERLLKVVSNKI